MEKYIGQSGVFKVDNYNNMHAVVGGCPNTISKVSIGVMDVDIMGKKEMGLHFIKCNKGELTNNEIKNIDEVFDDDELSFIYIPHSKDAINSLIEHLNYIKQQL